MKKKQPSGYTDQDILYNAGLRYSNSLDIKGIQKGKSKVSMWMKDNKKSVNEYRKLIDAAGSVAAMTCLEKGEKILPQYSSIVEKKAPYPLLFAEAAVKKRSANDITVNVSVLGLAGETLDFGKLRYKILRK